MAYEHGDDISFFFSFFLNGKLKTKETEIYDLKFASAAGSVGGSMIPAKTSTAQCY